MKFKIILPETNISPEEVESRIKRKIKEYKDGILAKVFLFAYINQPLSTTELTKKMKFYYHQDFDRATIFRYLKELIDQGVMTSCTSGYAVSIKHNNEMIKKIRDKFHNFMATIPEQFRKKFKNVNYFYISEYGEKFIPWCCEVTGFKFKKIEK